MFQIRAIAFDEDEFAFGDVHFGGRAIAPAEGACAVIAEGVVALRNHVGNRHDFEAGDVQERRDGTAVGGIDGQFVGRAAADLGDLDDQIVFLVAIQEEEAAIGDVDCRAAIPGQLRAVARQRALRVGHIAAAEGRDADTSNGGRLLDVEFGIRADREVDRRVGRRDQRAVQRANDDERAVAVIDDCAAVVGRNRDCGTVVPDEFAVLEDDGVFAAGDVLADGFDEDGVVEDEARAEAAAGVAHVKTDGRDRAVAGRGDEARARGAGGRRGGRAELCGLAAAFGDLP